MKNKIIIGIVVVALIIVAAFLWFSEKQQITNDENLNTSWQTYVNEEFGYSVDYPENWTFREFPDTKTGAGFRPKNSSDEIASECVTIDERGTAANEYETPFADYVKSAAIVEIQGYEELNSIEPVATAEGLIGYKTTWIYKDVLGQENTSLPITYFDNERTSDQLRYKTVQISLNDSLNSDDCLDIYNQMILTLKLLP